MNNLLWGSPIVVSDNISPFDCSPRAALGLSQQASSILSSIGTAPYDDPRTWQSLETLFYACLRTEDDQCARRILDQLAIRFTAQDFRVMAMKGLYEEATAKSDSDLERILRQYAAVIETDPTNIPVAKRRVGLLKSLGKTGEAVKSLVDLLTMSPTDAEAWTELAELYIQTQSFKQAIYCLEEVLLITPNSWSTWSRSGEVYYAISSCDWLAKDFDVETCLQLSVRSFSRSLELCDGYVRALCGLKLACRGLRDLPKLRGSIDSVLQLESKVTKALSSRTAGSYQTEMTSSDAAAAKAILRAEDVKLVR